MHHLYLAFTILTGFVKSTSHCICRVFLGSGLSGAVVRLHVRVYLMAGALQEYRVLLCASSTGTPCHVLLDDITLVAWESFGLVSPLCDCYF